MASELKVNKISPESGTTLTLGDSGDTINFGSGVLPNFENLTVTGDLTVDTNSLKVDSTNNFVGIGTATPSVALDVVGAITATGNITGTLATAAQPNITSVGTLSSLSVSGNITGTLATASQPNITSVGTLTSATVSGDLTVDTNTLYVDSTNNRVGIGTSSPSTPLQIESTASGIFNIATLKGTTSGNAPRLVWNINSSGTQSDACAIRPNSPGANQGGMSFEVVPSAGTLSEAMRIDSSGRLLIGKTSGDFPLDVDASDFGGNIIRGTRGTASFTAYQATNSHSYLGTTNAADLVINTNNAERMRITSAGLVGIGTSSPTRLLTIADTGGTYMSFDDSAREFLIGSESNQFIFYDQGSSAYRMAISQTGNVGIGTTSPSKELHVYASSGESAIQVEAAAGDAGLNLKGFITSASFVNFGDESSINVGQIYYSHSGNYMHFKTNGAERMRIESDGDVLISKTSNGLGTVGIELASNGKVSATRSGDPAMSLNRLSTDGDILDFRKDTTTVGSVSVTSSGTTYNTTSDYRLKDNIEIITDGTERLMKLKPVRHSWKESSVTVDGFLAHEVQEAGLEYAVTGEKDGKEMQSMDYGRITPILVSALQNAINEINILKQQIQKLEVK